MSYKKQLIKIDDLLINPENPRFDPVKNQKQALSVMIDKIKDKIMNIAEDISKNELNPGKKWYVVEKDGKYIVLEGNRRLTAIKLINNPKLIDLDRETTQFFQNLNDKFSKNMPKVVECVVFNNKEDAYHWIELEHTGENNGIGLLKWDHEQKERFKSQVTGSKLAKGVQVLDLMRDNSIDVHNIDATNIDRLVSTPYVREQVGIGFKDGAIILIKNKGSIIENFDKIAKGMNEKGFNVGRIYTAEQRIDWIDKALGNKTETPSLTEEVARQEDPVKSSIYRGKKREFVTLIDPKLHLPNIKSDKIKEIFHELQKVILKETPTAAALLLRTLMELTIKEYAGLNKEIKVDKNGYFRTDTGKAKESLKEKIDYISSKYAPSEIQETVKIFNGNSIFTENLNKIAHSKYIFASSDKVKDLYKNSKAFWEYLIGEIIKYES